jgi:hypothetical protein
VLHHNESGWMKQDRCRNMKPFVVILFIVAVMIGSMWRFGVDPHAENVGASIDATELWRNPWPPPGASEHR